MRRAHPLTLTALAMSATLLLASGARAQQAPELGPPPPPPPEYAPSPATLAPPVAPGELGPPPPPPPGAVAPPPLHPPPVQPQPVQPPPDRSAIAGVSATPAMPPPPWWNGQGSTRGGRAPSSGEGSPSAPPDADSELVRRSPGMMATGIVLTSGGGIAALAGAFLILAAPSYTYSSYPPYSQANDKTPYIGALVVGFIGIGIGIPLTVVGARKITRGERERGRALSREPGVRLTAGMGGLGVAGAW